MQTTTSANAELGHAIVEPLQMQTVTSADAGMQLLSLSAFALCLVRGERLNMGQAPAAVDCNGCQCRLAHTIVEALHTQAVTEC